MGTYAEITNVFFKKHNLIYIVYKPSDFRRQSQSTPLKIKNLNRSLRVNIIETILYIVGISKGISNGWDK